MAAVLIECPHCRVRMHVPHELVGRHARCKGCGQGFTIQPLTLEDSVVDWLSQAQDAHPRPQGSAVGGDLSEARAAAARPERSGPTDRAALQSCHGEPLRLAHTDQLGAFFVFPSTMLLHEEFRASLPRCCLCCGTTHSLNGHLVVWTSKLPDRDRMRLKGGGIRVRLLAEDLVRLSGTRLLAKLPAIPNMPPPFNLPMPYFICNRCSPVGALMTHVRPRGDGQEECELGIASLKRAAEFLAHNLGRDHDDYRRLHELVQQRRNDPWRALPLAVQNRIHTWFEKQDSEHFLTYVHDNDFARAEAGQGGLVLTNKRLIYHKYAATREISFTERLELRSDNQPGRYRLHIASPGQKPVQLHCDPECTDSIRAILREAGVQYTYRQE